MPRQSFTMRARRAGLLLAALAGVGVQAAPPSPDWAQRLRNELVQVDGRNRADIGVYVRDLDSGESASYQADQTWYLASTIKLPVALVVLGNIQRGAYTLSTPMTVRASDPVDGAGSTNRLRPGASAPIRELLEQMMVYSDNTASDMLIGLVGLRQVNALVRSVVPQGFQPITTLADVRRHIYTQLTPAAAALSDQDFLLLKQQRNEADRRKALSQLLNVPATEFRLPSVADAYDAYYATGLNSARLDAYGELLALVAQGRVLDAKHTAYLVDLMARTKTGPHRIKAGLPPGVRWSHKTGTQSSRTCDSGVLAVPQFGRDRQVVVAACTRGDPTIAGADRALREVGLALCRSGLLTPTAHAHDTPCPPDRSPATPPSTDGSAGRAAADPGGGDDPDAD